MTAGYYRFPTIHHDAIVFVSEDDLWSVPAVGGLARRLTSNLGEVNYPALSPDGRWLAFVGREEGMPEVYVMPAEGGTARRLTYLNSRTQVIGWTPDGSAILFASTYQQFYQGGYMLFRVAPNTANGAVEPVNVGPARSITYGPNGASVIGRNTGDPARWKRYRGGTAGHLWIDRAGDGNFERFLTDLQGNIASPMWLEVDGSPRVFFVSDHQGVGNLYSCTPDARDLRRHTDHDDFYTRNPSTDGRRIVYHAGADLYLYDPAADTATRVEVDYRSPRVQRNRKFVYAAPYLEHARLHPSGAALTVTTRGKAFAFFNHEGPVVQLGQRDGVRYRLADWLDDGAHVVMVDDAAGEEELVIFSTDLDEEPQRLTGLDIGRPVALRVSPVEDKVAISNHRNELLVVDLKAKTLTTVDRSLWRPIAGFDWSPDGRWLAYGFATTLNTTEIRLYRLAEPETEHQDGNEGASEADAAATPQDPTTPVPPNPIAITRPVLHDIGPAFDPDGKYLYFLSYRDFNPVYDNLHLDLSFPWGMRPYLITLRADLANPFVPRPDLDDGEAHPDDHDGHADDDAEDDADDCADDEEEETDLDEAEAGEGDEGEADDEDDGGGSEDDELGDDLDEGDDDAADDDEFRQPSAAGLRVRHATTLTPGLEDAVVGGKPTDGGAQSARKPGTNKEPKGPKLLEIDLDGIDQRLLAFPVSDSRYGQVAGAPGRAIFTSFPLRGMLDGEHERDDDETELGSLRAWVFKDYKSETIAENVTAFELSRNHKKLVYFSGKRLRVINASEKAPGDSGPGRKSGWVDLSRIKVSIRPQSEWEQMYREAWRLQRDHFWTQDMAEVDWRVVYERYFPLISRLGTRSEFSDLVWEMQGELGSSHAYEYGGDYRPGPHYSQGELGAELTWEPGLGGYRVGRIVAGDSWTLEGTSPLLGPGVDVREGDLLLAINGQRLDAETSPAQLLVNQAGNEVLLTLAPRPEDQVDAPDPGGNGAEPDGNRNESRPRNRTTVVRALYHDGEARYRAWVEGNRRTVHAATGGRIGYLHIPDMGPRGYAEFHRGFLAEVARDGLIVDVRYNGGGHVSQLLLEKLARRRIGYDQSRWGGIAPYPSESVAGPVVALTNEHAGSDGDIFCHSFKLLKLGTLVGKRTWGGVIGIHPRHPLVDGTVTTQPEFSFWFEDVGWMVENYGTEPDIEVDDTPQEYVQGRDAQLERAIAEALRLLEKHPVVRPDLATRPSRALPRLPRRGEG